MSNADNTIPSPFGEEQIVYKGKLIEVVEQPMRIGDKIVTFEAARRPPGTRLIITSSKGILLTREYRTELKAWDLRLPGGKVFDSLDEYSRALTGDADMLALATQAAKKEALEEVGLVVEDLSLFSVSRCGVTMIWDLYYFTIGSSSDHTAGQQLELGENIEVIWHSFESARVACLNGEVSEDRTAAVLLRFLHSTNT